jgi:hypothetical protein
MKRYRSSYKKKNFLYLQVVKQKRHSRVGLRPVRFVDKIDLSKNKYFEVKRMSDYIRMPRTPRMPLMAEYDKTQYDYTHFSSVAECDTYLRNNRHITISHLCCGGKGYAVPTLTRRPRTPKNAKFGCTTIHETTKGTCDICFLEGVTLHHTCTACKQPFCLDCLQKLPKKLCPNCRSPLRD